MYNTGINQQRRLRAMNEYIIEYILTNNPDKEHVITIYAKSHDEVKLSAKEYMGAYGFITGMKLVLEVGEQ